MSVYHPYGVFVGEAIDLLSDVDEQILALEAEGNNPEAITRLFRALHTLKGSAACVGLYKLSEMAHEVEDVASGIRDGRLSFSSDIADALLAATDVIRTMVDIAANGDGEMTQVQGHDQAIDQIRSVQQGGGGDHANRARIEISLQFDQPVSELLVDPLDLVDELASLGDLESVTFEADPLPPLADLDPDVAHLQVRVVLRTHRPEIDAWNVIGVIAMENQVDIREAPPKAAAVSTTTSSNRPAEVGAVGGSTVRVSTAKLDDLLNGVGSLVQAVARAAQVFQNDTSDVAEKQGVLDRLQAVSELLQHTALDLRMVPLAPTFKGFERTVRDLTRQLDKEVRLEFEGSNTELDKTMLQQVSDPLRHLVRNALDHGVEPPDERERQGKPRQALVTLAARQKGSEVVIEVRDDGRGINTDVVRAKALEKGLIQASDELTRDRILELPFYPGFSTAKVVTDVSGRGVGLDVVRQNIESLGGRIGVESTLGEGSTFRMVLPLSMMILDAVVARVGSEHYAIPGSAIREQLRLPNSDLRDVEGGTEIIDVRGTMLPVVWLRKLFKVPGEPESRKRAVVIVLEGNSEESFGVVVDDIESRESILIRPIEKNYREVPGFSGVTMLGSGELALVLDSLSVHRMGVGSNRNANR